jgi:hypothetical protein
MPLPSSTEHGWPFSEGPGQVVSEHDWEAMAGTWQVSGVVGSPESGSTPSAGNQGLYALRVNETQIQIQPGVASIAGHYYELKIAQVLDLDITGSDGWDENNVRHDLVTLRLDREAAGFRFVQIKNAIDLTAETLILESDEEIPLVQLDVTNGVGLTAEPIDRRWFVAKQVRAIRGDLPFLDPIPSDGELGVDTTNNFLVVGQAGEWVPAAQVFANDGSLDARVTAVEGAMDALEDEIENLDVAVPQTLNYSISGTLATGTGTFKLFNDTGKQWTIGSVRATVGTAPVGGTGVRIDLNKNGSSIFASSGVQPTIAPGNTTVKSTGFATNTVDDGQYLTLDVDSIGSTNAGADLSVQVVVS